MFECPKQSRADVLNIGISDFEFVSDFDIRILTVYAVLRRLADENLPAVAEAASFSSDAGSIAHGKLSPAAHLSEPALV